MGLDRHYQILNDLLSEDGRLIPRTLRVGGTSEDGIFGPAPQSDWYRVVCMGDALLIARSKTAIFTGGSGDYGLPPREEHFALLQGFDEWNFSVNK